MEKPISVGDLVQVVRAAPCGCSGIIGLIFEVGRIVPHYNSWCAGCGLTRDSVGAAANDTEDRGWCDLYRLKRIPPLEELAGTAM